LKGRQKTQEKQRGSVRFQNAFKKTNDGDRWFNQNLRGLPPTWLVALLSRGMKRVLED
jgi:hypothetical protein